MNKRNLIIIANTLENRGEYKLASNLRKIVVGATSYLGYDRPDNARMEELFSDFINNIGSPFATFYNDFANKVGGYISIRKDYRNNPDMPRDLKNKIKRFVKELDDYDYDLRNKFKSFSSFEYGSNTFGFGLDYDIVKRNIKDTERELSYKLREFKNKAKDIVEEYDNMIDNS